MKYLKAFKPQTKKWYELMIGLKIGDNIICIDDSGGLKYGEKYTICSIADGGDDEENLNEIDNEDDFVFVEKNKKSLYTRAFRFIPEEYFEQYEIEQTTNKYNL